MPTPKDYLYAYIGRPEDYPFDVTEYAGRYGGLINIRGLRHKNIVVAGRVLYNQICEHFAEDITEEIDRWEFMHELSKWSAQFVKDAEVSVGKQTIIRGQLSCGGSRYFCIPPEALFGREEDQALFIKSF